MFCPTKRRLMDAFIQTVHEMNEIERQQVRALVDGDPDFSRFDTMLHYAQEKKDMAKYAWIAHVESHSC